MIFGSLYGLVCTDRFYRKNGLVSNQPKMVWEAGSDRKTLGHKLTDRFFWFQFGSCNIV